MSNELSVVRLGTVAYDVALRLQRHLAEERRHDRIPDVLLLLAHPHTYTFGRRTSPDHLLWTEAELSQRNIAVYDADRGGDITYHGPGQIVGYPILKRSTARPEAILYLRQLEGALVDAARQLGVAAGQKSRYSGVWVGDAKLCAIGVKVDAYGITSHGFAMNVSTDLSLFDGIVPCGIYDMEVTSLQRALRRDVPMDVVDGAVVNSIRSTFGYSDGRAGAEFQYLHSMFHDAGVIDFDYMRSR